MLNSQLKMEDLLNSENQLDRLIQRYEQAMKQERTTYFDTEELEEIADYYLMLCRPKDSLRAVELGQRLHPNNTDLQIKRARVYFALEEDKKAMKILRQVELSEHNDIELLVLKAEILIRQNQLAEADEAICAAIAEDLVDAEYICLEAAYAYLRESLYTKAMEYLNQGLAHNPENIDILSELAFCYEQVLDISKAIEVYDRILDINPHSNEAWFNLGQIHFGNEQYAEAIEAYHFALAIDETDLVAYEQLGHAYFQMDNYARAVEMYQKYAERIDDENPAERSCALAFIGECYEKQEDYSVAERYYSDSIALHPENPDGWTGLAVCALEREDYENALIYASNALSIDPDVSDIWVYAAEALVNLDRSEEALYAYEHSLGLDPHQPDTLVAAGNIYLEQGNNSQALATYLEAREIDPETEDLNLFIAIAYFRLGQYELSFQFLNEAHEADNTVLSYFLEFCPEAVRQFGKLIKKK